MTKPIPAGEVARGGRGGLTRLGGRGDRNCMFCSRVVFACLLGLLASSSAYAAEPRTTPEAMTVELDLFGGAFFVSDDHELFESGFDGASRRLMSSPALELGLRAGFYPFAFLGIEAEGVFSPVSVEGLDEGATMLGARAQLVGQIPMRVSPFLVVGGGVRGVQSSLEVLGEDWDRELHWGLGAKGHITELVHVRLDGRHVIAPAFVPEGTDGADWTSHFELLLGVGVTFPREGEPEEEKPELDSDGDGRVDAVDACPLQPASTPDGCPVAADRDSDGVKDAEDGCPDQPSDRADGCPLPDADEDGTPDAEDRCPGVFGSPAAKGCPDGDGDGISDGDDLCPAQAGDDGRGCPDPDPDGDGVERDQDRCPDVRGAAPHGCPDGDLDGIPDAEDDCPTQIETWNGLRDEDGCPDEIPAALTQVPAFGPRLSYSTGPVRLARGSARTFARIAEAYAELPGARLEVRVHTEDTGQGEVHRGVAREVATRVKTGLVKAGMEAERISTVAVGPDEPIDTNKTASGRRANRRIDLIVILP